MLNIETKVDSAEKLAAVAGKPTENFLFAGEVNQIVTEVNNLEATLNPDRLISLGTETIDENEYTYEGYTWQLGGVQINNIGNPSIIVISSATIGYKRNDISVFKADGTIERIAGTETNGEVVATPDVPEGTLFYKSYSVDGIDIEAEPEPPAIDGSIYKKKIENTRWKSMQSGSEVVIPFQAAGQSHYSVVHSGLSSVAGFSTTLLTTPMYEGQDVLFENQTGNPIGLKNMFVGVDTPFNLGADLVVPNEGNIWFKNINNQLKLVMKSWGNKRTQSLMFQVPGATTLAATQVNYCQSRFNSQSVFGTLGLVFSAGVAETSGALNLGDLSDKATPEITPNYISKVKNIKFSYSRNVAESGANTNLMIRLMGETKYNVDMQLIAEYNLTSSSATATSENKVDIPVLTHLPLSAYSNLKWCIRVNNATAQTFNFIRLNIDIEEV